MLRLFESGRPSISAVVGAVEADLALTVTVVRLANQLDGPMRGRIESVVTGVEALSIDTIHAIASRARTFDFFERTAVWQGIPERLRLTRSPRSGPPIGSGANSAMTTATG